MSFNRAPPHLVAGIVSRILTLAIIGKRQSSPRECKPLLCSASLVDKTWRNEAQRLLLEEIEVTDNATGNLLLRSEAFGEYPTSGLNVSSNYRIDALEIMMVDKLVLRAKGLRRLSLTHHRLDFCLLGSINLSELEELEFQQVELYQSSSETLPMPTSLRNLKLVECTFDTNLFPKPYSSFYSPSLSALTFSDVSDFFSFHSADLTHLINLSSSHLSTIDISGAVHSSNLFAIASCPNLIDLNLNCEGSEFTTLARALPPSCPLRSLSVDSFSGSSTMLEAEEDDWVTALNETIDLPGLKNLKSIRFGWWCEGQILASEGGPELLEKLEEKEIEVVFDVSNVDMGYD